MGHTYAGILGPLAFLTSLARGVIHGHEAQSLLWTAWCSLLAFAVVGYLVGWVAGKIIEDSVRSRIAAELAAEGLTEESRAAVEKAAEA